MGGVFEDAGKAIDGVLSAFAKAFAAPDTKHVNCRNITMTVDPIFFDGKPRYMDIKPPETYEDYQLRKWLSQVPHGGIVDNMAVLICYNEKHPSQSLVIVEDIKHL